MPMQNNEDRALTRGYLEENGYTTRIQVNKFGEEVLIFSQIQKLSYEERFQRIEQAKFNAREATKKENNLPIANIAPRLF